MSHTVYSHPDGFTLAFTDNDAGNLAEQAGAGIGIDCLNAILAADTQGKRIRAIQSAVRDLQRLAHPKRAAGGPLCQTSCRL